MTKRPEPRETAERHVKDIGRKTRRKFSSEEKIRIVLEGLRGEYSIAELCKREGIATGDHTNARTPSRLITAEPVINMARTRAFTGPLLSKRLVSK